MKDIVRTTIIIPSELDKKLANYAKENDLSKSQVIRLAIRKVTDNKK